MNIYDFIKSKYIRLSKGHRKVAQFILDQPNVIATQVAAEVGRLAGVSESTVIRFCYALELSGYGELQKKMHEHLALTEAVSSPKIRKSSSDNVVKAQMLDHAKEITKLLQKVDSKQITNALTLISDAQDIFIVGFRENELLAKWLHLNLVKTHNRASLVRHEVEEIAKSIHLFSDQSVLIVFTEDSLYEDLNSIMEFASLKAVQIVLIHNSKIQPYRKMSDANIILSKDGKSCTIAAFSLLKGMTDILKEFEEEYINSSPIYKRID